jgi:hypothetical protein
MPNQVLVALGISGQKTASTFCLPWTPTDASNSSCPTPKAKSFQTRLSSGILTSGCLRSHRRTRSSMDCKLLLAIAGANPPTSISQLDAIANLQDIFESWRLLAPPHLRATRRIAPGHPRVESPDATQVATPATHERSPQLVSPQKTLPASPTNVLASSLHRTPPARAKTFQATPHLITFGDSPSPRVAIEPPPMAAIEPSTMVAIEPPPRVAIMPT